MRLPQQKLDPVHPLSFTEDGTSLDSQVSHYSGCQVPPGLAYGTQGGCGVLVLVSAVKLIRFAQQYLKSDTAPKAP